MKKPISRRDFLRLTSLLGLASITSSVGQLAHHVPQQQGRPNIIIILFDALSARHLSLYGYRRQTSPNLERFAQRATVYHQHHSAANFTTPSTASLFTGTYPFTHRTFGIGGKFGVNKQTHNLLAALQQSYTEAVLVQNIFADLLLYQMNDKFDVHFGPAEYYLVGRSFYDHIFQNDPQFAARIYDLYLFDPKEHPGSMFAALPLNLAREFHKRIIEEDQADSYPDGLPYQNNVEVYFTLEQVMDGAYAMLSDLKAPFFSYLHFLPPHWPYRRSKKYVDTFKDGWTPDVKKTQPLSQKWSQEFMNELCVEYDEFIAHVDSEFGRLVSRLEVAGLLENSYVIITSDHGELFERGEVMHDTPLLYEGIVHIPLLIHAPGQTFRQDIHKLTSNVDLFPTLAALSGLPVPETIDGYYLPGLGLQDPPVDRSAWIVEAKLNLARAPLTKASLALLRWPYKLIHYFGYQEKYKVEDSFEFYDLEKDPEEMENLVGSHPAADEFRAEMDEKLSQVDAPYQSRKQE